MKNNPTYRLFSSYLLLVLVLWASRGQAMDSFFCACSSPATAVAPACCMAKDTPSKTCSKTNKPCDKNPQLEDCCCEEEVLEQALLPSSEELTKDLPATAPMLSVVVGSLAVASLKTNWAVVTPPSLRQYWPPLLCRDIPVFVQSFLL